ncbi:dihydroxyacetone kinase transcriptional activator DhaS [Desulfosporosinus fructosivorans]|uniref:Dihydroxyacetone kinase transcriptional activator DhaS n=1 Tax=Desulfosporosinus fructosivorans TaxID=2018669 RepID=A0A4Z0R7L5_9FIRM|nr:dihydroxyacetone kinase transcriptional activator DhaS [Desulfosporosinus fructosivorans]TGE38017.1 dihydroxyacetone kinase transcriptional activator DhaS [Desulfosporosinus fructosivorans]
MPRSSLTKKALATSLKRLMEKIPLNKITVQEIVNDCELNRQTFYYHFQDIFDLLGWIYKTEAVESIADYKTYTTWEDGFLKIFLYIERNKAFCLNTLNSLGRDHLDSFLQAISYELLIGVVNEVSQDMCVKVEDKEFIANFYTLAFIGLVIQWMKTKMTEKPEVIIKKLSELVEGNFASALRRYGKEL